MGLGTAHRWWGWVALLCALGPGARAGSVSVDVTAGRGALAWSLLGDVDLVPDKTILLLGYSAVRPQNGSPLHQLTAGVDHGLGEHWRLSGLLDVGLPTASTTQLLQLPDVVDLGLRSSSTSAGLTLRAAWDSAGLSDVEWGVDGGLGTSRHALERTLFGQRRTALGTRRFSTAPMAEDLVQLRPSLGAYLLLWLDTELTLRGSYALYSRDPLTLGQLTAARLDTVLARQEQQLGGWEGTLRLREQEQAAFQLARESLAGADASDGLLAAPLLADVRLGVSHRFSRLVRGQLGYTFTRYVPTQGSTHVLSTRWTLRFSDAWRAWAGVSLQTDVLEDAPPQRSGLVSLGGEYAF